MTHYDEGDQVAISFTGVIAHASSAGFVSVRSKETGRVTWFEVRDYEIAVVERAPKWRDGDIAVLPSEGNALRYRRRGVWYDHEGCERTDSDAAATLAGYELIIRHGVPLSESIACP